MLIEKVNIHNFKALQDVTLDNVPAVSVFVGKNGVGKTTLFRVFAFLQECLQSNVSIALRQEGGLLGFKEVLTRGKNAEQECITIEIQFRLNIAGKNRLVTYLLKIGLAGNKPVVKQEILRYKRGRYGSPFHFIDFENGKGTAVSNE
jgi:predicted ATPase